MEIARENTDPDYDVIAPRRRCCKKLSFAFLGKLMVVILLVTLFILLVVVQTSKRRPKCEMECFYHVGGGSGSGLLDFRDYIASGKCNSPFNTYIKDEGSQYWKDTERAIAIASRLLIDLPDNSVEYDKMVVFDIDETVLSNLEEVKNVGYGNSDKSIWEAWVDEARAPAIPASLQLYKDLRGKGYSILFLTGRHEHMRGATSKNLEASGFGTLCKSSKPKLGEICYHSLVLRENGDDQDALLYKSAARGNYTANGFELVAGLGDQWSDLLGTNRPTEIFKLPNPFYFIP